MTSLRWLSPHQRMDMRCPVYVDHWRNSRWMLSASLRTHIGAGDTDIGCWILACRLAHYMGLDTLA